MRHSILFIVILIGVSGFIAYFGDLLGRKMGKKRLTLFNLRPRHTAIIATTITGMLISAIALTALLTADLQFRRVLTEGKQIFDKNERLSFDNLKLESRNKALLDRSKELEKKVAQSQKEVEKAHKDSIEAKKTRDVAVKAVTRLEKEIAERKNELDSLRKRSDVAERDLKQKTAELASVHGELVIAQKGLSKAQSNLANAETKLTVAQLKLRDTQDQLAQAEKTLKDQETALEEQRKQLTAQHELLVKFGNESIEFQRQTSELRSRELIFRQGDELLRGTISSRQSPFGIRGDLVSLLNRASEKAKQLGAKVEANDRAVALVYRQAVDSHYGLIIEDEKTCIDMAIDFIAKSPQEVLIQIVCTRNSLTGEQAQIELRPYKNNLIYRKGDLIASTNKVNGRMSEGRILLSVIDFLQKQVGESALRAGVIPISNPDPHATLGQNPQDQVEDLMEVIDRIKVINARVNLEVYARADVYAIGPLNMTNMRISVLKLE